MTSTPTPEALAADLAREARGTPCHICTFRGEKLADTIWHEETEHGAQHLSLTEYDPADHHPERH